MSGIFEANLVTLEEANNLLHLRVLFFQCEVHTGYTPVSSSSENSIALILSSQN